MTLVSRIRICNPVHGSRDLDPSLNFTGPEYWSLNVYSGLTLICYISRGWQVCTLGCPLPGREHATLRKTANWFLDRQKNPVSASFPIYWQDSDPDYFLFSLKALFRSLLWLCWIESFHCSPDLEPFCKRSSFCLGLKQLRRLSLSRNAIKSVGRHALSGLPSLEQLDLADNVISTIQGESRLERETNENRDRVKVATRGYSFRIGFLRVFRIRICIDFPLRDADSPTTHPGFCTCNNEIESRSLQLHWTCTVPGTMLSRCLNT
jgi:hypothetical protein